MKKSLSKLISSVGKTINDNQDWDNLCAEIYCLQCKIIELEEKKREENIILLNKYSKWLVDHFYCDTDIWCEKPTAVESFLSEI